MACVYRHIRLDKNEVFYIGIGKSTKRAYTKDCRNTYWKNIVLISEYRVDILFEDVSLDFAKQKEIEFISIYGRKDLNLGTLCNLTDGGESTIGRVVSEEERKRRSKIAILALNNPNTRKKMSESGKGKIWTDEMKRKISDSKSYPVIDIETKKTFVSLRRACEYFGESYRKHQGRQAQGLKNIRFKRL